MVIGLRFKCATLFTRHRHPSAETARWKPQAGRPRAHMNLTQVLRAKAFEIILLDSRRISVKDGPVNRAANYLSSPSPACPPVWRAPLPERPPDPSPPAAAAPLPARARPTAPRGRRRRAAPAPASRATAATRRVPMHHTWSIATVTARHRQNSAHMRGMVLRCIVVVWENHLTDLACCRSPVRADRCRDDKVSVATIVGANQPSA